MYIAVKLRLIKSYNSKPDSHVMKIECQEMLQINEGTDRDLRFNVLIRTFFY
jgi:hypothetical protein